MLSFGDPKCGTNNYFIVYKISFACDLWVLNISSFYSVRQL